MHPEVENSELLGSGFCYTAMNFRKIGEAALNLKKLGYVAKSGSA